MHSKLYFAALIWCTAYAADMAQSFALASRRLVPTAHNGGGIFCMLAQKQLSATSYAHQVAMPYQNSPESFGPDHDAGVHGYFALFNLLALSKIHQEKTQATRAAHIASFYATYWQEAREFGEPLLGAFGEFSAEKVADIVTQNLPTTALQNNFSFVDSLSAQRILENRLATPDGNILGRYHAQLQSGQDFSHGILFACPQGPLSERVNHTISIFSCREQGLLHHFIADSMNMLSAGREPSCLGEPFRANDPETFIRNHLDKPRPIYCYTGQANDAMRE